MDLYGTTRATVQGIDGLILNIVISGSGFLVGFLGISGFLFATVGCIGEVVGPGLFPQAQTTGKRCAEATSVSARGQVMKCESGRGRQPCTPAPQ